MSGGSYNYICYKLSEECEGRMHDAELNELVKDLSEVLHDLEWWQSADTDEERYRRTVRSFKRKWFVPDVRERNLEKIINEKTENLRTELLEMIGGINVARMDGGDENEQLGRECVAKQTGRNGRR